MAPSSDGHDPHEAVVGEVNVAEAAALVGGVDDASGLVTGAVFHDKEDAGGYHRVLRVGTRSPVGRATDHDRRHGSPASGGW